MPLYTQCLNLCFLMATFCPSIAMQAVFGQGRDSYSFNLIGFLRAVLVYYALVLTGIYLLSPPIKAPLGHSDGRLLIIGFKIGRHTSELQSRQYLVCRLLLEK